MACAPNKLGVFSAHFRRFDMISNRLVQPKPPVLVHFQTVATSGSPDFSDETFVLLSAFAFWP